MRSPCPRRTAPGNRPRQQCATDCRRRSGGVVTMAVMSPLTLHPRPAAAGRPHDASDRARAVRRGPRPADHLPARPRPAAVAGRRRPVQRPHVAAAHPRPLRDPAAARPGRLARRPRRGQGTSLTDAQKREAFRLLCTHWKAYRGTPVKFWLEAELVDVFGVDVVPVRGDRRRDLRHASPAALVTPDVPAPRPVRTVRHRGARHHRRPVRRPVATTGPCATTRRGADASSRRSGRTSYLEPADPGVDRPRGRPRRRRGRRHRRR